MNGPCTAAGCDRDARGNYEWCELHYRRWQRFGDANYLTPRMVTRKRIERFWEDITARVAREDGPCMEWPGARNDRGYGHVGRKQFGESIVSRAVWAQVFGPIPDGMQICHRCDNPPCARPAHLFLGTPLDNARDMVRKGRNVRHVGDSNVRTKIPDARVNDLRRRWLAGETAKALAEECGVHPASMSRILRGLRRTEATPIEADLLSRRVHVPKTAQRPAKPNRPTPIARRVNEAAVAEHNRRLARAVELYRSGLSTIEVGKEVGWDSSTLSRKLRAAGVEMRRTIDYHPAPPVEVLVDKYVSGAGLVDLAREFHLEASRVAGLLRAAGVQVRRPGRPVGSKHKRKAA